MAHDPAADTVEHAERKGEELSLQDGGRSHHEPDGGSGERTGEKSDQHRAREREIRGVVVQKESDGDPERKEHPRKQGEDEFFLEGQLGLEKKPFERVESTQKARDRGHHPELDQHGHHHQLVGGECPFHLRLRAKG